MELYEGVFVIERGYAAREGPRDSAIWSIPFVGTKWEVFEQVAIRMFEDPHIGATRLDVFEKIGDDLG